MEFTTSSVEEQNNRKHKKKNQRPLNKLMVFDKIKFELLLIDIFFKDADLPEMSYEELSQYNGEIKS
jgi:hypothetical protein